MGLRELKKEQTRQTITAAAWRLFVDRGFDRVTVADVAREARVAEATVFNYFRSKEDLFFSRLEEFGARLVDSVSTRAAGETVLAAVRSFVLAQDGLLARAGAGDQQALERLSTVNRLIAASPALRAREQRALLSNAERLAALLVDEAGQARQPGAELVAQVVASALLGVHGALITYVRQRVLADDDPQRLAADVRRLGNEAFALLEKGLADYGVKPANTSGSVRSPSAAEAMRTTS